MNNNFIFLKENNFNSVIELNDNQQKDLYIIDTLASDVSFNLKINLKTKNNFSIILSSLNKNEYVKNFNITIFHNGDSSKSKCDVFGVNNHNSKTSFFLEAIIKDDSKLNYCEQKIKGVLLSNTAEIKGKPNLIINTNNIKAKHALAIGKLNPAQLFYLQNKGIRKPDAKKLLLLSHFNVVLQKIDDESLREKIQEDIFNELGDI